MCLLGCLWLAPQERSHEPALVCRPSRVGKSGGCSPASYLAPPQGDPVEGKKNKESRITTISLDIYSPILTDFIRVFLKTVLVSAVVLGIEFGAASRRSHGWLIHAHREEVNLFSALL